MSELMCLLIHQGLHSGQVHQGIYWRRLYRIESIGPTTTNTMTGTTTPRPRASATCAKRSVARCLHFATQIKLLIQSGEGEHVVQARRPPVECHCAQYLPTFARHISTTYMRNTWARCKSTTNGRQRGPQLVEAPPAKSNRRTLPISTPRFGAAGE